MRKVEVENIGTDRKNDADEEVEGKRGKMEGACTGEK